MSYDPTRRLLVYAEGAFGKGRSKTADGVIRYGRYPIVGVVDSTQAGKTSSEIIGWGGSIPVIGSIDEALPHEPQALLIGIAPPGGQLPAPWRRDIVRALECGMDIINGLHEMLGEDAELAAVARRVGRRIWDVRLPTGPSIVGSGKAANIPVQTLLTVGTDCAIGKMTVLLEMEKALRESGRRPVFLATGQTGIMISGFGVPLDRVIGDFMAGAIEHLMLEHVEGCDLQLIEGQGSLYHPGFSGVTLSLLHGSAPSHMLLCHEVRREFVRDSTVRIPPLDQVVHLYETMARPIRPSKVVGVSLNTRGLDETAARQACLDASRVTGLPATDAVRFGTAELVAAVNAPIT